MEEAACAMPQGSPVCSGKPPIRLGGQSTVFKVRVAGEAAGREGTGKKLKHERLGASALCDRSCCAGPEDRRQRCDGAGRKEG